jgi:hypothetical protein
MTIKYMLSLIPLALVGCTATPEMAQSELPVFANYPQTIDAIAATGVIEMKGKCLVFTRSDGATFVPIFRTGATIEDLRRFLGPLDNPVAVTVSGYNKVNPIPLEISRQLAELRCEGTPILYGEILRGTVTPQAPQT